MRFSLMVILFLCSATACSNSSENSIDSRQVQLDEHSPRELLAIMSEEGRGHIFVLKQQESWVNQEDIPFLVQELESDRGSMSVSLLESSYLDDGRSSIAAEAYFMLLGYKHGVYPPAPNSTRHQLDSKADLLSWLENEQSD